MNQRFTFAVEVYKQDGSTQDEGPATVVVTTTGSQETRARRRLLEALHARGAFARQVTLVEARPVK